MLGGKSLLSNQVTRSTSERRHSLFIPATYCFAIVGLVASFSLAANDQPLAALVAAALLCGWSEIDGLCGMAHLCTLSPLRALDSTHNTWCYAVVAYVLGGVVSAAMVGAIVGAIGDILSIHTYAFTMVGVMALALAARELKLVSFRLPQVPRQTQKQWAFQFGIVPAAAMWGSHIGIGFATVINHGGFFVLVALAFLLGPASGALLMIVYWFGRTLPILLTPLLTADCAHGQILVRAIADADSACRHTAVAGLLGGATVAVHLANQAV